MIRSNVVALPRKPLAVPSVALAGSDEHARIEWRFAAPPRLAEAGPEMLARFVALTRVDDDRLPESVLTLAREFGPLSLAVCVLDGRDVDPLYGIRHAHVPVAAPEPDPKQPDAPGNESDEQRDRRLDDRRRIVYRLTCRPYAARYGPLELADAGWEPVALWRVHAARLAAILDVAAALRDGRLGDRRAWSIVTGSAGDPRGRSARDGRRRAAIPFPDSIADGRLVVQAAVRDLLDVAAVRFVLTDEPGPALELTGDGLGAALAVQTALRIAGAEGVAICAECGAVVPDRTPDSRRAFCVIHRTDQIKSKWAQRDARRRARDRAPVGLTNEGAPE
jgi:hypothetical protein